ncbi:metallophosphoesterase family protein [Candidatus Woesearchaeota archaeon]|nr:metallophosphoesterase family protein [Candidatus Woesearchaeota archaeon]
MNLAFISDIHSNLEALNAVLADIRKRKIRKVYCCGDIVGYGANPNEVIRLFRERKIVSVMGNHDLNAAIMIHPEWFNELAAEAIVWTNSRLTEKNRFYLSTLPPLLETELFMIVHGSPREPVYEYVYPESRLKPLLGLVEQPVLVMGHTHLPFVRKIGKKLVINPGSVGQPRDKDVRASYAVFDTKSLHAEIVRVSYDIDAAAKKILKAKLPRSLAERLYRGI